MEKPKYVTRMNEPDRARVWLAPSLCAIFAGRCLCDDYLACHETHQSGVRRERSVLCYGVVTLVPIASVT